MPENITRTKEMDLRSSDYEFVSGVTDAATTYDAGEVIEISTTPGTNQVHANDVDSAPDSAAGIVTMNLDDGNSIDTDFFVSFAGTETVDEAAEAIVDAFNANVTLSAFYTASVDGTDASTVLVTANSPAANDTSLELTVSDANSTGLTIAVSTGDDVAGVAGSTNCLAFTLTDVEESSEFAAVVKASQVKAAKASEAITYGTAVFWDPDNDVITKVSDTGHVECGIAVETAVLADEYVLINFDGKDVSSVS